MDRQLSAVLLWCSTSNEDGIGIAWAVCEHFIRHRVPTFFVTHYHQLAVRACVHLLSLHVLR